MEVQKELAVVKGLSVMIYDQTCAAEKRHYDFEIVSYIDLVAEAIGLAREDKFKQYTRWGDLERILQDAEAQITSSPFPRERIIEVIRSVFSG